MTVGPGSHGSPARSAYRRRRMAATDDLIVRDNPAELRYEIAREGTVLGHIRYRTGPGRVVLVHTEVEPEAEGGGVGSRLVAGALENIRARGLRVVPLCPFVAAYIRRHPEWADLVVADDATPD